MKQTITVASYEARLSTTKKCKQATLKISLMSDMPMTIGEINKAVMLFNIALKSITQEEHIGVLEVKHE